MADLKELIFEATRTRNNIRNHEYDVQDYPMCKKEADIVMVALQKYIDDLEGQNVIY